MENSKKKVLIYSLDFYPDHSGISIYSTDFARFCKENNFDVTVITGFPFYPNWKKRETDRRTLFRTDIYDNIKIKRGYIYIPKKISSLKRIIHELSFLLFAFFNSLFIKKPNYVVAFTTPVLLGALVALMNKFWKAKLIINVQDFQIEAATSLGMLKESTLLKYLEKIEKWSYDQSTYVSSISQSMIDLIAEKKNIAKEKILFWPNWLDNPHIGKSIEKGVFRLRLGLNADKKIIAYAGNIGKKQGLEALVDLAVDFKENTDIIFLIIGNGAGLPYISKYAASKKLNNLLFFPFLNAEEYQYFLNDIDLFFISQIKIPFDVYFPSKLLGIMSSGVPLLVYADKESELYKTLGVNKIAVVCNYGDKNELNKKVKMVLEDSKLLKSFSENSKNYSSQYERELVLNNVVSLLS